MKSKPFTLALLGLGVCIGVLELTLRFALGLGNPLLSQVDENTGYRFQPNQKIHRFGNNIEINQFSQRNALISQTKPRNTRRILMIGDSILFGGSLLDQSKTITEKFRQQLGNGVEVLNASAGSWGVENRVGYLREFGHFQSDVITFQIGTSDLTQPTATPGMVGTDVNMPNRHPSSAIAEAWTRYLAPMVKRRLSVSWSGSAYAKEPTSTEGWFKRNLQSLTQAIRSLRSNPQSKNIPVIVFYTPNLVELVPTPYAPAYKAEFFERMRQLKIPVIDIHRAWSDLPVETRAGYYTDGIHLSEAGNQAVADLLFQELCIRSKSSWCKP